MRGGAFGHQPSAVRWGRRWCARTAAVLSLLGLTLAQAAGVREEHLSFTSGGLTLGALVCRPDGRTGRPLLNIVHGGLNEGPDLKSCQRYAKQGFVVAAAGLRGQHGNAGRPGLCLNEVEDVTALRRLVEARYRTDRGRVAYLGASLGGCVALKAAARDPRTRAAVLLVTPVDFAALVRRLSGAAARRWTAIVGAGPQERPDLYARLSPVAAARAFRGPLLLAAGGNDPLVLFRQACLLRDARRAAGRPLTELRQTRQSGPSPTPITAGRACPGEHPVTRLPPLKGQDLFLYVTDAPHAATPNMWRAADLFLRANVLPRAAAATP